MDQKSKMIGSTKYLVTQMDAISFLSIQTKLMKICGEGVFALIGSKKSLKEKVAIIAPRIMNGFDDKVVSSLVLSLFDNGVFTEVEGIPKVVDFGKHFIGKPVEMWKVAFFIMEANLNMGELSELNLPTTEKAKETQES